MAETDDQMRLLAAHCMNLDPATPTARERVEQALGKELAAKLLFALAPSRAAAGVPARLRRAL